MSGNSHFHKKVSNGLINSILLLLSILFLWKKLKFRITAMFFDHFNYGPIYSRAFRAVVTH